MILAFHIEEEAGLALVRVTARQCRANGEPFAGIDLTVRPEDWSIPAGMSRTTADANRYGVPLSLALRTLAAMAETATAIVAHWMFGQSAYVSKQMKRRDWLRPGVARICTAELSAPFTKLMEPGGDDDDYRLPSLEQAAAHFKIEATGAEAVMAVYDSLREKGILE